MSARAGGAPGACAFRCLLRAAIASFISLSKELWSEKPSSFRDSGKGSSSAELAFPGAPEMFISAGSISQTLERAENEGNEPAPRSGSSSLPSPVSPRRSLIYSLTPPLSKLDFISPLGALGVHTGSNGGRGKRDAHAGSQTQGWLFPVPILALSDRKRQLSARYSKFLSQGSDELGKEL